MSRLVAGTLRRPGLLPGFSRTLEDQYQADGRERRIKHLRLSIAFGLVVCNLFVLADAVLVPDATRLGFLIRSVILTPVGILIYVLIARSWMSCRMREAIVSLALTVFSLAPLAIFAASRSPHCPLLLTQSLLVLFFASNVLQLPLLHALAMFGVNFAATAFVLVTHPTMAAGLVPVFLAYAACTALFGAVCNYAIERRTRDAYLLALQERLRSDGLNEDRNKLAVLSETDWLTDIANRRSLDHHLDAVWADPRRSTGAALVLLDIDHFKRFNDFYGHLGGDQCLRQLAAILSEECRGSGVFLARYGGEEFAIAIDGMAEVDIAAFADRLCRAVLEARMPHLGRRDGAGVVTVSLGLARVGDEEVVDRHSLFAAADRALYAAKRMGRNRVVRFGSLEMLIADQLPTSASDGARMRARFGPDEDRWSARLAG